VPWLCHEFVEGQIDLDGRGRPELDLGAFIDLCWENGLYFFVRPGPFIMAEMKNEGLPYWVYKKHPDIIPVTWDGKRVPIKTLDYLAPGFLAEAGDLRMHNFQDLYLMNAFMDAVNNPDQPLTSVEFEAGSGDYGGSFSGRHDPSTVDFKTRMCIAQGNRLVNYYLFTGGINYVLDSPVHDGNDRIAFTGERHGTAAPVNPEGVLNYTFPRMARAVKAVLAVEDKLAAMTFPSSKSRWKSWVPGPHSATTARGMASS
jgi:hypothetical protein